MQQINHAVVGNAFFAHLERVLPPFFTREMACDAMGGLYKPGTLANLDRGNNKLPKMTQGKKVLYKKEDFIPWLRKIVNYPANDPVTTTKDS